MINENQLPKKKFTKFFEKYLNSKTISLPKFVEHVIQTPKFRIISHIDGFFTIEQKLESQKEYSIVSIQNLFSQYYPNDLSFIKLLRLKFCAKQFITIILNHQNYIFIIFQEGQISICGKTGKTRLCFQHDKFRPILFFISRNKSYFISYRESDCVVYHISSGEIFCFKNSSLKSILLNPNSKLNYDFLKENGKLCGFVNSEKLFNQMVIHICEISFGEVSVALNEIDNI